MSIYKLCDFSTHKYSFPFFLGLTILLLTALAWVNTFIQDDAFISFRYAENLNNGRGLVWNEGEKVEGYTNFLWTLLISGSLWLGFEPVIFTRVLGIYFFVISLFLTARVSILIFENRNLSLLTVLLLGTNYTFSAYATGGLETQLQACLFLACIYTLLWSHEQNQIGFRALSLLSLLMAIAMLTRPDSAVLVGIIFPLAFFLVLLEQITPRNKAIKIMALSIPFLVLVGSWLIWKLLYYGDILPNTFYVKVPNSSLFRGAYYLYIFLFSYWLIPLLILGCFEIRRLVNQQKSTLLILISFIFLWLAYIVKIGGDFMEFRLFVPILPLIFILITALIYITQHKRVQIALVILILAGSVHHALTFGRSTDQYAIITVKQLNGYLSDTGEKWIKIGQVLRSSFQQNQNITIATTAAGAIPYYSGLKPLICTV
ncbi:MAG: hypothetical protein R3A44_05875 [Caldilineaceae bacterium]